MTFNKQIFLRELYLEAAVSDQTGEDMIPPGYLADLTPDQLFLLLAEAEREARQWRKVKAMLETRMARTLKGRKVRYGDTLYRSRRKTIRSVPEDRRSRFFAWVAEGGAERVQQLFNPNQMRYGQLRDLELVDRETGEILPAFDEFVEEITGEDAPWGLEAVPVSKLKFAQSMAEGEVQ